MLEEFRSMMERKGIVKLPQDRYSRMYYPRFFHLMEFDVERYDIDGFGSAMSMHTTTKMGMELLTISMCPGKGCCLPYLLLDTMAMGKKRCSFVEFYGCGFDGLNDKELRRVCEKYKDLTDYAEKPGWYIAEREPYSLIKSGEAEELSSMVKDSLDVYLASIGDSRTEPVYRDHLELFRDRMVREGNPSSKTLNMLLGKDGAERFMKEVIMPISAY
jgi:hypothetical protein